MHIDGIYRQPVVVPVQVAEKRQQKKRLPSKKVQGFMLLSLLLISGVLYVYTYYPRLSYSIQKTVLQNPAIQKVLPKALASSIEPPTSDEIVYGNWLHIPAIGVKAVIQEGKDISVLDREEGVWHQAGEVFRGNFVIAGHRFKYLPPNTSTLYNLDKIQKGDEISLFWQGEKYEYVVTKIIEVDQNQVEILNSSESQELTLYTCIDEKYIRRLVVKARLK